MMFYDSLFPGWGGWEGFRRMTLFSVLSSLTVAINVPKLSLLPFKDSKGFIWFYYFSKYNKKKLPYFGLQQCLQRRETEARPWGVK
jgi:hypothetical protein